MREFILERNLSIARSVGENLRPERGTCLTNSHVDCSFSERFDITLNLVDGTINSIITDCHSVGNKKSWFITKLVLIVPAFLG